MNPKNSEILIRTYDIEVSSRNISVLPTVGNTNSGPTSLSRDRRVRPRLSIRRIRNVVGVIRRDHVIGWEFNRPLSLRMPPRYIHSAGKDYRGTTNICVEKDAGQRVEEEK